MEFIKLNANGKREILDHLKRFPHLVDMGDDYYFDGKTLLFEYLSNEYDYPTDIFSFTSNQKLIGLIVLSEINNLSASNRHTLSCFDGIIDLVFFPTGTSDKLIDDMWCFISTHLPNYLLCYNEFYHELQSKSVCLYFEHLELYCLNSKILLDDHYLISKKTRFSKDVLHSYLLETFKPKIVSTSFQSFNSSSYEDIDILSDFFENIPNALSLDTNFVSKLGFDFVTKNALFEQLNTFTTFLLLGHAEDGKQVPLCVFKLHESKTSNVLVWRIDFINTNEFYFDHGYAKELFKQLNIWSEQENPMILYSNYVTAKGRSVGIDEVRKTYWNSSYVKHFSDLDDLHDFIEVIREDSIFSALAPSVDKK